MVWRYKDLYAQSSPTATLIFFRTDEMVASKAGYGLAELQNVLGEPGVFRAFCAIAFVHLRRFTTSTRFAT